MSSRNTRSSDYSNTSTSGVTAGEAVKHPVDTARAAMSSDSGTNTGTTGHHTGEPYSTGRGGAGNLAGVAGATTTGTHDHHTGTHTGTHTGASTGEGDQKPTMGEKIKGSLATMTGKMTNDPEKVAEGEQLKEGSHPSQTGSSATG